MNIKNIKKYIKHFFREGRYDEISTKKEYYYLENQVALCEVISSQLKEDKQKVATALSELFCMDWACKIEDIEEGNIPFGYPSNGIWYFPTGREYMNQKGRWFIEFEPDEEEE